LKEITLDANDQASSKKEELQIDHEVAA